MPKISTLRMCFHFGRTPRTLSLRVCVAMTEKTIFYKFYVVNSKCNFPLSSGVWTAAFAWQSALFALATIRPLDESLYASRPYHRSPLQGTHGDRVAGDNTRSRHNLRQFSHCATSLCAPATQQHGAVACTLRQVRRSMRSPPLRLVFRLLSYTYRL